MRRRLLRLVRALDDAREQIVFGLLTAMVLLVGYLVAIEARGEPVRSHAALLLLVAFAFLAGWLHEIHRPGGSYDLREELNAHTTATQDIHVTVNVADAAGL